MVKTCASAAPVKVIHTSADDEDVQHIQVQRSRIFSDALRQFSRETFDYSKMLRLCFIGEAAVDEWRTKKTILSSLTS